MILSTADRCAYSFPLDCSSTSSTDITMSAANVCVFVPEDRFQNKRDPTSHRIIEKRRRDRMNNCLADLSRLIPAIYLKKVGRGRVEKTEIIEMAIKHLKHLQTHTCTDPSTCEVAQRIDTDHRHQYRLGFHECMAECIRYLVDYDGRFANEEFCIHLMTHLKQHLERLQNPNTCFAGSTSNTLPLRPSTVEPAIGSNGNSSTPGLQGLHQASQQLPSIPIQIHPPSIGLLNAMGSPATIQLSADDVKPLESEPSESAFTRRAGGTFAPRGGLLFQGPHEKSQVHQLMVPKQEVRPSLAERKAALSEIARNLPGGYEASISQLREILQTPCSLEPGMRKRSNTDTNMSTASVSSCDMSPSKHPHLNANPNEEVYHFKKNIKDRFQSNLRLFTASPTESVDGEDSKDLTGHEERRYSHSQVQGPVASPHSPASFFRNTVSAPPISNMDPGTANCAKDLSVHAQSRQTQLKWEPNQMDSSSSAGSPPGSSGLPSLPRSSGSTSGYSSGSADTVNPVLLHPHSSPPLQSRQGVLPPSVPIFALHPEGTYYIPLTMDISLISPFIQATSVEDSKLPVLHPVSISVKFGVSSVCNDQQQQQQNHGIRDEEDLVTSDVTSTCNVHKIGKRQVCHPSTEMEGLPSATFLRSTGFGTQRDSF